MFPHSSSYEFNAMQNGRTSSDSDPLFFYPGSTLVTNSMAYNNTPFRTNQTLLSTASQPMQYCWPPVSRCYQPEGTTGGKMAPYVKSEGAFSSSGGRKWREEEGSHITVASCISNSRRRSSTLERDCTVAELSRKMRSPGVYSPNGTVSTEQTITKTPARKSSQKLGDKVNALQQLVSPFGKTDTASVLQEATAHIRLLHQQIGMLIAPYFSYRPFTGRFGDGERFMDLRSRGLCLVAFSTRASNAGNEDTGSDCLTGGT